jgi:erythromycin esterase
MVKLTANPLKEIESIKHPWDKAEDLDVLLDRIGNAHYVLLGEASHGTSEYYAWRAQISQRLIAEKGFSFIAVEGDWPDCYRVNRYIKHCADSGKGAQDVLHNYKRWPTWMWANYELIPLIEWLRQYNLGLSPQERVGFYGLDVYSLWDSMRAVIDYLEKVDPSAVEQAKQAYRCFEPFGGDANNYAYHTAMVPESCETEAIRILKLLRKKAPHYDGDYEAAFDAQQNAQVVVNAERYYRTMIRADAASWNIRDTHMIQTLGDLMRRYGEQAKAIVWAHNTHVGDARYTDMVYMDMVNVGQLVREECAENDAVLVGFGSYQGTVIAGAQWDAPGRVWLVPPARAGSWEALMHEASQANKLILSDDTEGQESFWQPRGHRAIGVVYSPERERLGNYVSTLLPGRYDAFIYLDKTRALHPLHAEPARDSDIPETFPWAV